MNESGIAVLEFINYFKLDFKDLLVVVDDFNIPLLKFRLRLSGSDGGHNGLKSIIYHLNSENFARLRVGIGEEDSEKNKDFVLGKFKDEKIYRTIIDKGVENLSIILDKGFLNAMNIINKKEERLEK